MVRMGSVPEARTEADRTAVRRIENCIVKLGLNMLGTIVMLFYGMGKKPDFIQGLKFDKCMDIRFIYMRMFSIQGSDDKSMDDIR
jgi:hypothetical protein